MKTTYKQVLIEDLGEQGEGICKADGLTCFVRGVVLGDEVTLRITSMKKNYALGEAVEITKPSPDRIIAPCQHYPQCGGCQIMDLDYQAQLRYKERKVRETLARIAGIERPTEPIIGMELPWHYRNKMAYPVKHADIGMFAQDSHHLVPIEHCLIHPVQADSILEIVRKHLKNGLSAYDEHSHSGSLRHVLIRYAPATDQFMVVFVTHEACDLEPLIDDLKPFKNIISIIENKNHHRGNTILGGEHVIHFGQEKLTQHLSDLRFELSEYSFYQVNSEQMEKLYSVVKAFAGVTQEDIVFDIYAGMGTIGSMLAKQANQVYCIESVAEAVEDGQIALKHNKLDNVHFIRGRAEEIMPILAKESLKADVCIVDPPRKGLDNQLIDALLAVEPKRIVYVSCKVSTLARDLKRFMESGYEVKRIQPVDLFPHSTHVETVVLMSRKDKC